MRFFPLLVVLLGLASASFGQTPPGDPPLSVKAPKPPKRITILPVPVLFYQQETGAGYGLGGLLSGRLGTDTLTRASNARAQFWTTQKSQSLFQFVILSIRLGRNITSTARLASIKTAFTISALATMSRR